MLIIDTNKIVHNQTLKEIAGIELLAIDYAKAGKKFDYVLIEAESLTRKYLREVTPIVDHDHSYKIEVREFEGRPRDIFINFEVGTSFFVDTNGNSCKNIQTKLLQASYAYMLYYKEHLTITTERHDNQVKVTRVG